MSLLRKIVLDTETTGLLVSEQHRIIEIACVEMGAYQQVLTSKRWLLNPERDIDVGATRIHGYSAEDLKNEPRFADIAREWYDYVRGSQLIIHNADFDVDMLNSELHRLNADENYEGTFLPIDEVCEVVDTIKIARARFPGRKVSLDALCGYFHIDTRERRQHAALLDCKLLLQVYQNLCCEQGSFELPLERESDETLKRSASELERLKVVRARSEELALHQAFLESMKAKKVKPLWPSAH